MKCPCSPVRGGNNDSSVSKDFLAFEDSDVDSRGHEQPFWKLTGLIKTTLSVGPHGSSMPRDPW